MKAALSSLLVDPVTLTPLTLEGTTDDGRLVSQDGTAYPIVAGIPRFVLSQDDAQAQTREAFGFKWKKRDTYDSEEALASAAEWYVEKYGFESLGAWARHYDSFERILDAGCGSGFSSSIFLRSPEWTGRAEWVGVDISEAIDVAQERLSDVLNTHYVQADVLSLPFADGAFDAIFSEGVLHHTPSTRAALFSVARVLASGGEAMFYVYKKKAPVREFTDDYIREQIASLTDEEAWDAMRPLTELGRVLAEAKATVELSKDVPLLGIKAGAHDVQRLLYWHFAKLFWNPRLSFEENVHVNFDWYRPRYAHRQTEEQVREWCAEAGLEIRRLHDSEAGYAVRAVKR
jgi:arsenite methyltransferase